MQYLGSIFMIPLKNLLNFYLHLFNEIFCVNRRGGMDIGARGKNSRPPACANKENSIYSIRNSTINYIKWNFLYSFELKPFYICDSKKNLVAKEGFNRNQGFTSSEQMKICFFTVAQLSC